MLQADAPMRIAKQGSKHQAGTEDMLPGLRALEQQAGPCLQGGRYGHASFKRQKHRQRSICSTSQHASSTIQACHCCVVDALSKCDPILRALISYIPYLI